MVDLVLFGFLKVTVKFSVQPAEPNVGIMHPYIDEWEIVSVEGFDKDDFGEIEDHILTCEEKGIINMDELIEEACGR